MPAITLELTHPETEEDIDVRFPAKWEICHVCEGEGRHSRNIGSMTQQDMDEGFHEVFEDYMAGAYDRGCEHCEGEGKVLVIDIESISRDPFLTMMHNVKQEWDEFDRQEARAIAAERAFGC